MSTYGSRTPLIDTFISWNSQINLSALREPEEIYQKHILDSIELNKIFLYMHTKDNQPIKSSQNLLDIGTGGGFPLLPLAITHPEIQSYGIDARQKKCKAVQGIADQLGLTNVKTLRTRIEDHKQQYDIVTARAVAHASKLIPRALPLVKKGGYLILYKLYTPDEDAVIINSLDIYKLRLYQLHHYFLLGSDIERVIYIIQK